MKNIKLLMTLVISSLCSVAFGQTEAQKVEICSGIAGKDAQYVKDFSVQELAAEGNEKAPTAKYSMILQKDTRYRITICTDDDSPGRGFVQLFDTGALLGSSYNQTTGKEYKSFEIDIQKTGVYHIFIQFIDGKAGKATVILSFVKKL
jgi:hypothetical protein